MCRAYGLFCVKGEGLFGFGCGREILMFGVDVTFRREP